MPTAEEFLDYYLAWAGPARRSLAGGAAARLPPSLAGRVVACGMGGSGVAGDYVEALSRAYGGAPVVSVKGPRPPAWLGAGDLLVAVSFSGNTRETLECATRGLRSGAYLAAVTTGGRLADLARRWGTTAVIVEEAPAPRAGWPQLFYTTAAMLQANGLLSVPLWDLEASIDLLERRSEVEEAAGGLAEWLRGVEGPLLVVAPEPLYPAAVRLRNELAENAKMAAAVSMLPEAGHNELEAWAYSRGLDAVLVDPGVEPWSGLLGAVAEEAGFRRVAVVEARGETLLQKLVWVTWVAGVASVKAAVARGVDPYKLTAVKRFRGVVERATGWGSAPVEAPRL